VQEEESIILSKELTEQEQATFATPLKVFSAKIISGLISRELQLRQHAIEHVKEHLENECYADEVDQLGDPVSFGTNASYLNLPDICHHSLSFTWHYSWYRLCWQELFFKSYQSPWPTRVKRLSRLRWPCSIRP